MSRRRSLLPLVRRDLYRSARLLGDVQAVEKGPAAMARRAERRALWHRGTAGCGRCNNRRGG